MLKLLTAFAIGLLFGIGILISGMANPAKVLNFFDLFGTWDPSLAFVMGGALTVSVIGYRLIFRMKKPLLAQSFSLLTRSDLDSRLIGGSAIFGIGWGISGICPGGLLPALSLGRIEPIYALVGVLVGIAGAKLLTKTLDRPAAAPSPNQIKGAGNA
ncbi:DUF6691 family protein [Roseibium sediminis]|uniref:DUF6691 family protein n=1 Tax=Roseibium sediminis TaxID=1775174 RepID=UPI00123D41F2|nr:DUF6691 family protein [Roseibium sediminis]